MGTGPGTGLGGGRRRFRFAASGRLICSVTMPWGPVLAACLTGIGVSLAGYRLAARSQLPGEILMFQRLAFAPVVAAVAVLVQDEHRPLVTALPAPAWLTTAARVLIALPVLVLTGWTQLAITAAELGATLRSASVPASALPWPELAGELAAWSAIALAAAALVARTRWSDIGTAIAVPAALAIVGMLALPAWHLLPTALSPAPAARLGLGRAGMGGGRTPGGRYRLLGQPRPVAAAGTPGAPGLALTTGVIDSWSQARIAKARLRA